MELGCDVRKGSVSYGLGADFSLPHCLVGDKGIGKQLGTISSRHKRSFCISCVLHNYVIPHAIPHGIRQPHSPICSYNTENKILRFFSEEERAIIKKVHRKNLKTLANFFQVATHFYLYLSRLQSRTQNPCPLAFWSAGGRQERLGYWNCSKTMQAVTGQPIKKFKFFPILHNRVTRILWLFGQRVGASLS